MAPPNQSYKNECKYCKHLHYCYLKKKKKNGATVDMLSNKLRKKKKSFKLSQTLICRNSALTIFKQDIFELPIVLCCLEKNEEEVNIGSKKLTISYCVRQMINKQWEKGEQCRVLTPHYYCVCAKQIICVCVVQIKCRNFASSVRC